MININDLPKSVKLMVQNYSGWIVGSAANPNKNILQVNDIDVIIPFKEWNKVAAILPSDSIKNLYGGWRYVENDTVIDVWTDDLNNFMNSSIPKYLWQPRYNIRYKSI